MPNTNDPIVTVQTESIWTVAFQRAILGGAITGAVTAASAVATLPGGPWWGYVATFVISAGGYILARGGFEGAVDNRNAQTATRTELKEAGLTTPK